MYYTILNNNNIIYVMFSNINEQGTGDILFLQNCNFFSGPETAS